MPSVSIEQPVWLVRIPRYRHDGSSTDWTIPMSYKIHNGFKFKTADMDDVISSLDHWKSQLDTLQRGWLAKLHADMAVSILDEAATSPGRHEGKVPLDSVRISILDRWAKMDANSCRDPSVDPDFRVAVYVHATGIYGHVRTERHEWFEEFMKTDFVEEFSYWNGTDYRPDDVSADEWSMRRTVWQEIIENGQSEAFQCADRSLNVSNREVFEARPDFLTRLNREARRVAEIQEMVKRDLESRPQGTESDRDRFDRLIRITSDLLRWVNHEGGPSVEATAAILSEVLLPDIEESDLLAPIVHKPDGAISLHSEATLATQSIT
jgi:hypothetical protein